MARRTSFHITEQAEEIVAENNDQAKRINFLIIACAELMESPTFAENEWMIIVASANGYTPSYKYGLQNVLDSFANCIPYADIFGREFVSMNKTDLAKRYNSLPLNQKLFAYELARKFWIKREDEEINSYREWLIKNGAKVI